MSLKSSESKYVKKPEPTNTWLDYPISEGNMTAALAQFLVQMSIVPKTKDIERIVVGDLANGLYPLAILTKAKGTRD